MSRLMLYGILLTLIKVSVQKHCESKVGIEENKEVAYTANICKRKHAVNIRMKNRMKDSVNKNGVTEDFVLTGMEELMGTPKYIASVVERKLVFTRLEIMKMQVALQHHIKCLSRQFLGDCTAMRQQTSNSENGSIIAITFEESTDRSRYKLSTVEVNSNKRGEATKFRVRRSQDTRGRNPSWCPKGWTCYKHIKTTTSNGNIITTAVPVNDPKHQFFVCPVGWKCHGTSAPITSAPCIPNYRCLGTQKGINKTSTSSSLSKKKSSKSLSSKTHIHLRVRRSIDDLNQHSITSTGGVEKINIHYEDDAYGGRKRRSLKWVNKRNYFEDIRVPKYFKIVFDSITVLSTSNLI